MEIVLQASDLVKEYASGRHVVRALDGVDLTLRKGEFIAIMGPSGSGKSTLLHLLGGLDRPTRGRIQLAGKEISHLPDTAATLTRRRNVGFVFQFFNLIPTLSAEENILLPVLIDGKRARAYQQRLDLILQRVGLSDRRQHRPDQLSGGEQQRVALARALITEPSIILADEPTGNLDTRTSSTIMELLQAAAAEFQQAIVMVTHDPRSASYAHRVVFLRDGQVVEEKQLDQAGSSAQRVKDILNTLEELEVASC
jgi:putative ABC transport system ATP-binding protein